MNTTVSSWVFTSHLPHRVTAGREMDTTDIHTYRDRKMDGQIGRQAGRQTADRHRQLEREGGGGEIRERFGWLAA